MQYKKRSVRLVPTVDGLEYRIAPASSSTAIVLPPPGPTTPPSTNPSPTNPPPSQTTN